MDTPTHESALPAGYALGEYRIDAILGQGGFGITYLATDSNLGAQFALKEFFPSSLATRADNFDVAGLPETGARGKELYLWGLQQFVNETRALAQFRHPNIVRVLRFFEAHNTAYMVMEYEQGQTLAEYLAAHGNRLTEQELLRNFIPVLNGLHAIHNADLLHLDIKPENIYLRQDGTPMLLDFGSARQPTSAAGELQPITLTPAYAAAEQYPDQGNPGPWTDLYAIGASMYRCVTGITPAGGLKRAQAVRQQLPDPLAQLVRLEIPEFPRFVLECIDWALEVVPSRRPPSARHLQEGLMGRGRPSHKPPPAPAATTPPAEDAEFALGEPAAVDRWKLGRWTLAGLIVLILAAFGLQHWINNHPKAPVDLSTAPRRQVADLPTKRQFTLVEHSAPVRTVVFLNGDRELLSADKSGQVLLWNARSGQLLRELADGSDGSTVVTAPANGAWFAVAASGGIDLRELEHGNTVRTLEGPDGTVTRLAASGDGNRIAAGDDQGNILIQNSDGTGHAIRIRAGNGPISDLVFSADGGLLAASDTDGAVTLWDAADGSNRFRAASAPNGARVLALSADGQWLAAAGDGGAIALWNPGGSAPERALQARVDRVDALAFSPHAKSLYAGLSNNAVAILATDTGEFRDILSGQNGAVRGLAVSPDGLTLATAGDDTMVLIWSAWALITGH